jgi:hypothetical protein
VNDSYYIERIITWLTASGVKVELYAFDLPCAGMYRSETREVFLNVPGARDALLAIAHEAGHWLGYVVFKEKLHSYQRERQAFTYGWRVLVLVGADRLITRKEWIQAERERRTAPDVDASGFRPREVESLPL